MRKVKYAGIQMRCVKNAAENIKTADRLVREAASKGAQIILLPELFENRYFCQERNYDSYLLAKPVEENDAVIHFRFCNALITKLIIFHQCCHLL